MLKLLYALITGLVGAGIVHISSLLLIPMVSDNDAWSRLSKTTRPGVFTIIDPNSKIASSMRALDPNFIVGACQFSLENGPVVLNGEGKTDFWSLSIFNKRGENLFSLNDRTSDDGILNMAVVTSLQFIEYKNELSSDLQNSVFAQVDTKVGFVILRAFVPNDSEKENVKAFVESSTCDSL
jgi:uncharacterized membrane protein